MVTQSINCPHCRAKKWMDTSASAGDSDDRGYFLFVCQNCDGPVVLAVEPQRPKAEFQRVYQLDSCGQSFEKCGWRVVETWPKPQFRKGTVPGGVPEHIRSLFEHAQDAAAKGGHDLAILGFHRALQMAQSVHSPDFKGRDVHAWVLSLVESGQLTAVMKTWLNRVKLRKDSEGASALEAEDCANFALMVLEQVFGINSRMAALRTG